MDRFLVKTPREKTVRNVSRSYEPRRKQSTIKQLRGVVVVEHVLKMKTELSEKGQDEDLILQHLDALGAKQPAVEVLQSTRIGRAVQLLTEHRNSEIANKAQTIVDQWTAHIRHLKSRPEIEVKCNSKTEYTRQKAREFLCKALQFKKSEHHVIDLTSEDDFVETSTKIEKALWNLHRERFVKHYPKDLRKIVSKLRGDLQYKQNLLDGKIDFAKFVSGIYECKIR